MLAHGQLVPSGEGKRSNGYFSGYLKCYPKLCYRVKHIAQCFYYKRVKSCLF